MQGPRSKCDQVIFEFIAKTTEIIVTSRCQILDGSKSSSAEETATSTSSSTSTSTARFNFSFPPVPSIRSLLQPWKHSLHVPLRVDIFYSHYPSDKTTEERILLERWCIDYVSYHEVEEQRQQQPNPSDTNKSGKSVTTATTLDNAEVLTQLRQLCKKIMISLRTIYCKARILPAYQLHCYLTQGIPLGIHRSQERGKLLLQLQQHQHQPAIGYIFYAAPYHHDDAADSYLQRNQFQQDTFRPLPTPYGTLRLSVWFHPQSNNIVLKQINSASTLPRTGPIQIPKHSNHHNLMDDAQYRPTSSAPSSNESGVHDFLIPDYSPKPESLMMKLQSQKTQQQMMNQQDAAATAALRRQRQTTNEADCMQQLSAVDKPSNIKPSMSGLSLALLQNAIDSQQQRISTSPESLQEVTALPTAKCRHRSQSLSYPVSPAIGAPSSSRTLASESLSPPSSYQPQHSFINAHHASSTQSKSLSPRSGHLQNKHHASPNQPQALQPSMMHAINSSNTSSAVDHPSHGHGYGYGYNNPSTTNVAATSAVPLSNLLPLGRNDSSETNRSGSAIQISSSPSPRYLSCSPAPFLPQTTSPGGRSFRKSLLSRANSAGVGSNTDGTVSRPPSPPFISHPLTLQQEPSSTEAHRNENNTYRDSSTTASMLLPPSSLETLLKSPFKSITGNVHSGTDNTNTAMWSSMNSLIPHFVPLVPGSQNSSSMPCHDPSQIYQPSPSLVMGTTNSACMFGAAPNAGGYMLSLSINSRGSAAVDLTGAPSSPRLYSEEMPFVDTDLATGYLDEFSKGMDVPKLDFLSSSVVAASSLAHKCATATRLSLFSQDNSASSISEKGLIHENQVAETSGLSELPASNNSNIAEIDHLAEFRDFGALMNTNLEKLCLK